MGILRGLLGGLVWRIVRLAIVVVALLLCYLLVIEPALKHGPDPQRLIHCLKHAHQDTEKLERCARRL